MTHDLDTRIAAASVRADRLALDWPDHRDLDRLATDAKKLADYYNSICRDAVTKLRVMRGVAV